MFSKELIIEVESLPIDIVNGATYLIKQSKPNTYTHGMFKYPCKFIPEIPRWGIKSFLKHKQEVVFDPFSGSGTTLLEANLNGFDAFGTEIDDIAKLIIKVKTTAVSSEKFNIFDNEYNNILYKINENEAECYRPNIDNLDHWFSKETIIHLGRMKAYIEEIIDDDIRDFFKVCMISIIKKVSYADDTSPKPYVSSKVRKVPSSVEKEFSLVYNRYKKMLLELCSVSPIGKTQMITGDALNFVMPNNIDLAITSPPYINAFDYGRSMRLENLWMSTLTEEQLRDKKSMYVGTEKIDTRIEKSNLDILERSNLLKECYVEILKKDEKRALIVKRFFEDMEKNLCSVYRDMKSGGKYIIVIGNSLIRKVNVESWKVIKQIAESSGFNTVQYFSYVIQNPYIRIPRQGRGGKISKDYVLVLEKGV